MSHEGVHLEAAESHYGTVWGLLDTESFNVCFATAMLSCTLAGWGKVSGPQEKFHVLSVYLPFLATKG